MMLCKIGRHRCGEVQHLHIARGCSQPSLSTDRVSAVSKGSTAFGGGAVPSASASTTISRNLTTMGLTTAANPMIYSQTGQKITFPYFIANIQMGNLGPAQFTVRDNLVSSNPFNCGPANTTLAPTTTVTWNAKYTTNQNDMSAVSITNIATASGGRVRPSPSASAIVNKQ